MKALKLFLILLPISFALRGSRALGNPNSKRMETSRPTSKREKRSSGESGCLRCHRGIEPIRDSNSQMMKEILKLAARAGFPGNDCIVCHGGNPTAFEKSAAHSGTVPYFKKNPGPKEFYPDPGSPWINANTCGLCHREKVQTQFRSLMFTEAGKIQGTLWGFGGLNRYRHDIGNYAVKEKIVPSLATARYHQYLEKVRRAEPQLFPREMKPLPPAPSPKEVQKNPHLAAFTYIRQECNRCHLGVRGRQKRGDYRGMGCSACHIPYSNSGKYEGGDPTIPRDEPGHPLVHSIQGTREAVVKVHGLKYSGIPVETCTTCHNRGKRIGVSYQGLMETSYRSPFTDGGKLQPKLHTKSYLHLKADIHLKKGMVCQDCHTSNEIHGEGRLFGTNLAAIEIECQDCHGTPDKYPWELPLGYGDEITGKRPAQGPPRGVSRELLKHQKRGTVYPARDGYLLTARGNPLPNAVRDGDEVIVHTAGGKDIRLVPLKKLAQTGKLSPAGMIAMAKIRTHIDKLECYTCHATWAPQCYGCHIRIDYSSDKSHPDWVAMGGASDRRGLTADARGEQKKFQIRGQIREERSYLRWEDPPLAVNGEHRISPAIPGCQTTLTIIGPDERVLLLNHIYKIPNAEGAGPKGQLAIDISPVHPHTVQRESRSCESCHASQKALGWGIGGGKYYSPPNRSYTVDLTTPDGRVIPKNIAVQFEGIAGLLFDWSRFVDEKGRQLQTVGHHFSGSRPLNRREMKKLDRRGVCLSCHREIPDGSVAIDLLHHLKEKLGITVDSEVHDSIVNKVLKLGAWTQVGLPAAFGLLALFGLFAVARKKAGRRRKK